MSPTGSGSKLPDRTSQSPLPPCQAVPVTPVGLSSHVRLGLGSVKGRGQTYGEKGSHGTRPTITPTCSPTPTTGGWVRVERELPMDVAFQLTFHFKVYKYRSIGQGSDSLLQKYTLNQRLISPFTFLLREIFQSKQVSVSKACQKYCFLISLLIGKERVLY